jgi:hypothetical protein
MATNKELKRQAKVKEIMRLLDCSEEDAIDVIETDEIIDKGGRSPYDLPIEEEKQALKIASINERKTKKADNQKGKNRPENLTKSGIIEFLFKNLQEFDCNDLKITNKERQIAFSVGENDFELTLVQKRKKKS